MASTLPFKSKPYVRLLLQPFSFRRHFSNPKSPRRHLPAAALLPDPVTPSSVAASLRSNPAAAATLFRRAAAHRGYRHTSPVYHEMFLIALFRRSFSLADSLADEVLAGACPDPDLPLLNDILRFCCQRNHLFSAFDVLNRMRHLGGRCSPSVETYEMILQTILRQFDKSKTRYVYMASVHCLVRQMTDLGLFPNPQITNLVIKLYCRASNINAALNLFERMTHRDFRPNELTYGYLVQGLLEKGRIEEGMALYTQMRGKGFVPTAGVYMVVMNGLSMDKRYDEGIAVLFDMLGNMKTPDLLTYRTLLEGLCRAGRRDEAFRLLGRLKTTRRAMNQKAHSYLLDGLHWLCQDPTRI